MKRGCKRYIGISNRSFVKSSSQKNSIMIPVYVLEDKIDKVLEDDQETALETATEMEPFYLPNTKTFRLRCKICDTALCEFMAVNLPQVDFGDFGTMILVEPERMDPLTPIRCTLRKYSLKHAWNCDGCGENLSQTHLIDGHEKLVISASIALSALLLLNQTKMNQKCFLKLIE